MMTLTQTERLVRKIAEMVAQPPADLQTAKLASDYAELCRAANRRLEQCAIMIEAGQFLQALQLSETAPPLMDLITLLAFRQAAEWRAYCQGHQLPWAEAFYDKYIRLLNEAYGKGICGDHPFYRDYRRAVMEQDDARAFSILRVIARLNPSDANTKEEMKRLEDKLLRVRLESLRQILEKGEPTAILAALEQLETSGLPVPASHPVWQQAQVARCQQMLRRAEQLKLQGAWQEAESLVEEIHSFATRYNVRLPDADADVWNALEEWTAQQRSLYAAEQDFRRALSALEYESETMAAKRAISVKMNKAAATEAYNGLAAKWREAERFGKSLPDELASQCQESMNWLQGQIGESNRRSKVMTLATIAVIVVVICASIPYLMGLMKRGSYAQELQQLEAARKVSEVETLLGEIPPSVKSSSQMVESLGKAEEFVAHEHDLQKAFAQKLIGLKLMAAGFQGALAQVGPARMESESALNQLAPEYHSAAQATLGAWDTQWQNYRDGALGNMLDRAEEASVALNAGNGDPKVREAVAQIRAALADLPLLTVEPPPLDRNLADRIASVTNKMEQWAGTSEKWQQDENALRNASKLDQYLDALNQMVLSPFATSEQKEAVGRISHLQPTETMLLGQLLLPNNPNDWSALTNTSTWNTSLMPDQPTSEEKDLYFKLRDDKNVRDVNVYGLVTNARPNNPNHSHIVFVQGGMTPDNRGEEAGMVHDPTLARDVLHFVHSSYSDWDYIKVNRWYRTLECDTYERLGLGELIDANTGNYQKPILHLFDQLNQDTNASAVFRAYVTLKLLAVGEKRPDLWGFQWCPDLAAHIQALTSLRSRDIHSGDWMVTSQMAKLEGPLEDYFARARAVPLEGEAQFLQQLVRQTCDKGFIFAGFIDPSGQPVLQSLSSPVSELCGWNANGSVAILLRKSPGADTYSVLSEPMVYTPLFVFAGDRKETLLQTLGATGFPGSLAGAILPPFYGRGSL